LLVVFSEGRERDEYALAALRIGLLSLRHARGQIDAEAVKQEDASYTVAKARAELETARKNRDASVGLFIFSEKTRPEGMDSFLRHGNDVFVVWDAERVESDVILRAGLSVAKALCVRQVKERQAEDGNWDRVEAAILTLEHEAMPRMLSEVKWRFVQRNFL
jgi:hypothetical protein